MLPVVLALSLVLGATYEGSPQEKSARAKGQRLVKEMGIDIDGDGKSEVAIAEALQDGTMRAAILKPLDPQDPEKGFKTMCESSARPAKNVLRFEAKRVAGRSPPELVAVFEDPSPDETGIHIRILSSTSKGVREIFAQTFYMPHTKPKDPSVVELGDASPHYLLVDVDEESGSDLEIVWVKEPQSLQLKTESGPVTFVIGAHRKVWRFDRDKEEYAVDKEDEVVDFLEPHPPSDVVATSQVPKIWGTAQAFWAADGDLDTAWNIEAGKSAKGQTLTLKWRRPIDARMIRVVPGCASDKDAWNERARVRTFRITLSSGQRFEIDRKKLTGHDGGPIPGVRAVGEFPLQGGFGAQVLAFLQEPQSLGWAKLEVVDLEPPSQGKGPRVNEACVSEISFH